MPFKSEAQRRYFHWAQSKGKIPKGTAEKWEKHTKQKNLPEYVRGRKKADMTKRGTLHSTRLSDALTSSGDFLALHVLLKQAEERQQMIPAPPNELSIQMDEQRKQDVHEQQLQFAQDKHQLDMMRQQMAMEQRQKAFELKQQHAMQQQQEDAVLNQQRFEQEMMENQRQFNMKHQLASQQQVPPSPEQPSLDQANAQMQHQHRQNVLDNQKQAQDIRFDEFGRPIPPQSAVEPTLLGGAIGGGAAHFLFPTDVAKKYRQTAAKIDPKQMYEAAFKGPKGVTKVKATGPHMKEYLKRMAYRKNALRLLKGTGAGLLGGLAIHEALKDR